jgi:hypothetical protein
MDTGKGRAYAEYSLGQAKKYGIKGSRVGALKAVRAWLHVPYPNLAPLPQPDGKKPGALLGKEDFHQSMVLPAASAARHALD